MTARGPGWYADPAGTPDGFRWWDGTRWTDVLTSDAGSPPPGGIPAPGFAPPGAVPPPPGAPGPGYLPYDGAAARPRDGADPDTEILSADLESTDRGRRLTAALAALALVAAGVTYLAFFRGGDEAERATPAATQDQSPSRPATPAPAPGDVAPGDETTPDSDAVPDPTEVPGGPRLEFTALPRPWTADPAAANILTAGQAQTQVTEREYNDRDNWVALLATGAASREWYDRDDLEGSAKSASDWFADEGFTGAEVAQRTRSGRAFRVDGRPAYLLEQHFTYRIDGLESRGEAVTLVVVDLGRGSGGIFLASIPDTHQELRTDVGKAMATLEITD
ncbi:DUF2510 domain-containing protein [Actinopolymorpha sp. B17G11]|uniref:DUF2510 domain-containing protein n=1 Tax=Actinopolymorpha sp. B17G11 TaxID=3160861 RepID=UPI0032E4736B